ncbi:MAG: transporter substrate-binding protein [Deltaproteobacteria bacterium]|nr:transporter substrate-binding protein [Deltaproteobacteria bacterium]
MAGLDHLRLLQFRAGYNLPVHAAVEHGIFAKHDLEVEFAYTPGSDYLIEALQTGKCEIAHPAADDLVAAVESEPHKHHSEIDLFLFMGLHSGLLSLIAAPEYPDVESLRGKLLGVDSRRTGFVFLLEKFLRSKGFGLADYSDKQIAATLLTSPFVADALASGCHLLAQGDQILPVYQATCGAARKAWARDHNEVLVRYIRAYLAATRWCFNPSNRRACLDLLKKHSGLDEKRAENTLATLLEPDRGLYPDAKLNIPGLAAVLTLRAEMGYLQPPLPPAEKYIDLSYYRRAAGVAEAS